MKSKLRRPFRAPREAVDRSKGGKVADQSDAAREEPPHNVVQTESEETTELGVVWKPFVVKETELAEVEPVGKDLCSGDEGKICTDGQKFGITGLQSSSHVRL
jgi:hypothetical protein